MPLGICENYDFSSVYEFYVSLLRGSANEWFEALNPYLFYSARIRRWFCEEVFLKHKEKFCAYILECPSTEVSSENIA